ncbi:hypothetical protein NEDG_01232 [Nematocida displodere]|uniref:Uncharacterized protein n=1 Tax=Nematocida displodere TaxID=1805483 RepID=A0A177EAX3_9MICR|nr:hypothetical protein NEDG_01232 [Nematocida displodere]
MKVTEKMVLFLVAAVRMAEARQCRKDQFNKIQADNHKAYVNANTFKPWPKDAAGQQNMDSLCQKGFTCIPNTYVSPPEKPWPTRPDPDQSKQPIVKNKKFRSKIHAPTVLQEGGCLGLDGFDQVGFRSVISNLYMAACTDCVRATQRTLAIVYSSFDNSLAKWQFVRYNGVCAIKNLSTDKYLTRCAHCVPNVFSTMLSLHETSIDDNSTEGLWEVIRTNNGYYQFKAAGGIEYLSLCEGCLQSMSTTTTPAALLPISSTAKQTNWSIEVDRNNHKLR